MEIFCPRCASAFFVRAGFVKKRQRYRCKTCCYHFTLGSKGVAPDIKRLAVHLYLEGMSFRMISSVTGVSDVAVAKWIRPLREVLQPWRRRHVKAAEIHKLEHFFITKEMFNKYGWLLIGIEENADICLMGSSGTGNCRLHSAEKEQGK
jgi:transposase